MMHGLILAAKGGLAVMLLVAGGAKVSDVRGLSATVRLFLPTRAPRGLSRATAYAIVALELALGLTSLVLPAERWPNVVMIALGCGFAVASICGFAFHRGRSCSCFGALSGRRFDVTAILRSLVITAAAVVALGHVPAGEVNLSFGQHVLVLAAGTLLVFVSATASRALAAAAESRPGLEAR
jgi:hypothetical protein